MDSNGKQYPIIEKDDSSLKQFFNRFYVIPKDFEAIAPEDIPILEKYHGKLSNKTVAEGGNGYIVFRGKKPKKLSASQIEEIKADSTSTQRELAFKYNCSHSTINKIKNNQY